MKRLLLDMIDLPLWCVQGIIALVVGLADLIARLMRVTYVGMYRLRRRLQGAPLVQAHDAEFGFGGECSPPDIADDKQPYADDHRELADFLRVLADHIEIMEGSPMINFLCFYHLEYGESCALEKVGFSLSGPDSHLIEEIRDFVSETNKEELEMFFKKGHANFISPSEWFQKKYMSEKN